MTTRKAARDNRFASKAICRAYGNGGAAVLRPLQALSIHESDALRQRNDSIIRLENIHRQFGVGAGSCAALRGITMEVRRGGFIALAGPSGSGKTSLLNIIGGVDRPSWGSVRIEERDLATMRDAELSDLRLRRIGFVFQDANLIPVLSVAENVELPLLFRSEISVAERTSRVSQVLESVGLAGKAERRPESLSGGERQRAGLARALAGGPAIVLADEPTANLDQETGAAVLQLMRSLNRQRGTTFLYSTHDPQSMAIAEKVLRLRDGRLEEMAG